MVAEEWRDPIVAKVDLGDGVHTGTISNKSVKICITVEEFGFIREALDNSPYSLHPMIGLFSALGYVRPSK